VFVKTEFHCTCIVEYQVDGLTKCPKTINIDSHRPLYLFPYLLSFERIAFMMMMLFLDFEKKPLEKSIHNIIEIPLSTDMLLSLKNGFYRSEKVLRTHLEQIY